MIRFMVISRTSLALSCPRTGWLASVGGLTPLTREHRKQGNMQGRKQFFFEKKNQKTFIRFGQHPYPPIWPGWWKPLIKVFCFFSSEKKSFPACPPCRPPMVSAQASHSD
ncbi:MAG TPA: hypothetical protein VMB71_12345 [Acetobacteraceae bacterium]|nr:hypothetical protein [Acetobacteraceae bacterium]